MTSSPFECKVSIDQSILDSVLSASSPSLIGSIDQGTSSSRFLLVTSSGRILSTAQVEFEQCFPQTSPYNNNNSASCAGWHEHDPFNIYDSVSICIAKTSEELLKYGLDITSDLGSHADLTKVSIIKAVGITNQRETTVAWNDRTGCVYYNAIVWDDTRTASVADSIMSENTNSGDEGNAKDALRSKTGLPIASYFAGTKVRWFIDNIPKLQQDLSSSSERSNVRFGTIDTWLLYMLTGYKRSIAESEVNQRLAHEGGVFKTDVSNASRWLFMNLEIVQWDNSLVDAVCGGSVCWNDSDETTIPIDTALPRIVPSSSTLGVIHGVECCSGNKMALKNIPVASILGDQQAALFGQTCFAPGEAKCTYGTGLFLMMNTGAQLIPSTQGLLTTVAYQLSNQSSPVYALEGSVAFSGSTIGWLRDRLELINSASETEALATSITSNENMYLVPAFSGLFAPHWRPDARGCMVGLTASHTKAHIVRAALESSAYQAREVFDAMVLDSSVQLKEMRVDGGATANRFLMQFQSDILNVPVVRPEYLETTGLGAAFAAGIEVGVWEDMNEVGKMWKKNCMWNPSMETQERARCWKGWNKAVKKSLNWIGE